MNNNNMKTNGGNQSPLTPLYNNTGVNRPIYTSFVNSALSLPKFVLSSIEKGMHSSGAMFNGDNIKVSLDLLMFILIAIASYCLIFHYEQLQHRMIIILIMFAYLVYFIKYRFISYINNFNGTYVSHGRYNQTMHSVQEIYYSNNNRNNNKSQTSINNINNNGPSSYNININNANTSTNGNNQSIFMKDYERRSEQKEKTRREQVSISNINNDDNDDEKESSFASYMSRSIKANQSYPNLKKTRSKTKINNNVMASDSKMYGNNFSMSASLIRNNDISLNSNNNGNDFSFLKPKNNRPSSPTNSNSSKLLRQSFITKLKSNPLNDSFIRSYEQQQQKQQQISDQLNQIIQQCNINFYKTLKKLQISQSKHQNIVRNVKKLCYNMVKQIIQLNMRNIKSIVEMVEVVYDVRVDLRAVGNNSREGEGVGVGGNRGSQGFMFIWNNTNINVNVVDNKAFNSYSMQISLVQLLSRLMKSSSKSTNIDIRLPIRKTKTQQILINNYSNNSSQFFISNRNKPTVSIPPQNSTNNNTNTNTNTSTNINIGKLVAERLQLNLILNSCSQSSSINSGQSLLNIVRMLIQYKQHEQAQDYQYQYINYNSNVNKVSQHVAKRMHVVFQLCRNRINQIISNNANNIINNSTNNNNTYGSRLWLMYRTNMFLGWIKKQNYNYELVQKVNNNYGQTHYNILVTHPQNMNKDMNMNINYTVNRNNNNNNQGKMITQQFSTQYGINNRFSVFSMYLYTLYKYNLEEVRNIPKMRDIINKCLDVIII